MNGSDSPLMGSHYNEDTAKDQTNSARGNDHDQIIPSINGYDRQEMINEEISKDFAANKHDGAPDSLWKEAFYTFFAPLSCLPLKRCVYRLIDR